jgi:ABC-type nitrate/sulfonate/bicarbonate transport system substrate-binding protein
MNKFMLFCTITCLLIAGCNNPEQEPAALETVRVGISNSVIASAIFVAFDKGYFEEEGIDVQLKIYPSGKASLDAMLNDSVDISASAPTPIVLNSFIRDDFSLIATYTTSDNNVKIIGNADSGIASIQDLRGKKVGLSLGTSAQFVFEGYLIENKILSDDNVIVNILPSKLPEALNQREVDAIATWEPHALNTRKLIGDKAVVLPKPAFYEESFNLLINDAFLEGKEETVQKFLKALVKATEFMNSNREESIVIISQRINVSKDDISELWDDYKFDVDLSQSLIVGMESVARWSIRNNLTDSVDVPNYLKYIHTETLRNLNPYAVTII